MTSINNRHRKSISHWMDDESINKIVFGYMRQVQQSVFVNKKTNPFYNIPNEVIYIILTYYYDKKQIIKDRLTLKLDRKQRPSIQDISNMGIIPENWLLDLYGLSDEIRRRSGPYFCSPVVDLQTALNIPPPLTKDIEIVDVYNNEKTNECDNLQKEIQDLENLINEENNKIDILTKRNKELTENILLIRENENNNLNRISMLENKIRLNCDQENEIHKLRDHQLWELNRLNSKTKAMERKLSLERGQSQTLRDINNELKQELFESQYKISNYKTYLEQYVNDKIKLIQETNKEIDELRSYIVYYQQYYIKTQQFD